MITDDPFFSPQADDKTILRPVPGGKRADIQYSPKMEPLPSGPRGPLPRLGRLNPLEKAASGLLALLARLNTSRSQADPMDLKNRIIKEVEQFQIIAQAGEIDPETVSSARYVLCTALDEAVVNTPWGSNSGWSKQSLLSLFHKEVSGGERFFHLLKSLAQNPGKNRDLLEIMYLCLALGFEGRYRLIEGGKNKLASIREWLYQILQKERGSVEQELSPHWQGAINQSNPLLLFMPLWVFGALAAGLLAIIFSILLFRLNNYSDPVFTQLYNIKPLMAEVIEPVPAPMPEPQITLSILLADEIAAKRLNVLELVQRSTVTIQSDNLFDSGSASVNPSLIPLLHRIADALNRLPGQVLITGHSDNRPIRSARYPSNWHLSNARATAVAEVIKQNLKDPERTTIEAKSDLEPIASNATQEGQAKNRRVEVTLLK